MKLSSAIFFSLILLLQSAGLTFGTHYCGGHAVKSSLMIGSTDLDCGMALMDTGCDQHSKDGINKKTCCENEFISMQSDNEFNTEIELPIPSDLVQLYALANSIFLYVSPEICSEDYSEYAPPLLTTDLPSLLQVFRI